MKVKQLNYGIEKNVSCKKSVFLRPKKNGIIPTFWENSFLHFTVKIREWSRMFSDGNAFITMHASMWCKLFNFSEN